MARIIGNFFPCTFVVKLHIEGIEIAIFDQYLAVSPSEMIQDVAIFTMENE